MKNVFRPTFLNAVSWKGIYFRISSVQGILYEVRDKSEVFK